jgi:predicted lipoprotein with Yx(FWY)xxD motif
MIAMLGRFPRDATSSLGMNYYKTSLRKKSVGLLLVPAAVALVIAGCGGGSGSSSATPKSAGAPGSTLRVAGLEPGRALVDAQGRTLYLFEADHGNASACSGACASIWPPATATGKTAAGPGVAAAKIATITRADGKTQLTYNGHPLYRYAADGKPGDANGQGLNQFGAKWYVLNAGGAKIDDD